jgi:hypothetical protein
MAISRRSFHGGDPDLPVAAREIGSLGRTRQGCYDFSPAWVRLLKLSIYFEFICSTDSNGLRSTAYKSRPDLGAQSSLE